MIAVKNDIKATIARFAAQGLISFKPDLNQRPVRSKLSAVRNFARQGLSFEPQRDRAAYMRNYRARKGAAFTDAHRRYMRVWRAARRQYIRDQANRRNRALVYIRNWQRRDRAAKKEAQFLQCAAVIVTLIVRHRIPLRFHFYKRQTHGARKR